MYSPSIIVFKLPLSIPYSHDILTLPCSSAPVIFILDSSLFLEEKVTSHHIKVTIQPSPHLRINNQFLEVYTTTAHYDCI